MSKYIMATLILCVFIFLGFYVHKEIKYSALSEREAVVIGVENYLFNEKKYKMKDINSMRTTYKRKLNKYIVYVEFADELGSHYEYDYVSQDAKVIRQLTVHGVGTKHIESKQSLDKRVEEYLAKKVLK